MFKKFRQLCVRAGLLPDSHTIPNEFIQTTGDPVAHGGFGDVWEGISSGERVAIKALRIYKDDDVQRVRKVIDQHLFYPPLASQANFYHKVFCKEVAIWKRVSHPNIVPFLGVSEAPAPLSMVSEWMPNGNVRGYVAKNPDVSRLQLVSSRVSRPQAQADDTLVTRHRPRSVLFTLQRYRPRRFKRGMPFFLFFISYILDLTISHLRIISSSTRRVVPDSTTSGSPVSPVSTAQKLPPLGSEVLTDGWHRNSSASNRILTTPVPLRLNQIFSHLEWSLSR